MKYRAGEDEQVRFRAKRIFNVEGSYYFHTREGNVVGPYPNESRADSGVRLYIQNITDKEATLQAKSVAITGIWASTSFR